MRNIVASQGHVTRHTSHVTRHTPHVTIFFAESLRAPREWPMSLHPHVRAVSLLQLFEIYIVIFLSAYRVCSCSKNRHAFEELLQGHAVSSMVTAMMIEMLGVMVWPICFTTKLCHCSYASAARLFTPDAMSNDFSNPEGNPPPHPPFSPTPNTHLSLQPPHSLNHTHNLFILQKRNGIMLIFCSSGCPIHVGAPAHRQRCRFSLHVGCRQFNV
jgi:hypothetical protein